MKNCLVLLSLLTSVACVGDTLPLTTSDLRRQLNDPYASVSPIGTLEQRIPDNENISLIPTSSSSCVVLLRYHRVQRGDAEKLRTHIYDYVSSAPLCMLVLDLSENGGGFVADGLRIVDLFVPRAHVMSKRDLAGRIEQCLTHTDGEPLEKVPLLVYVGPGTASTAEFITWALHDTRRALIVGTPTFGKGTVQQYVVYPASGYEIGKTAYYFVRRNGAVFHGVPYVPESSFSRWIQMQATTVQSIRSILPKRLTFRTLMVAK